MKLVKLIESIGVLVLGVYGRIKEERFRYFNRNNII